jgi:uncharacterized protein (DUF2267 family)
MNEKLPEEAPRPTGEELEEVIREVVQDGFENGEPVGEVTLDPRVARVRETVIEIAKHLLPRHDQSEGNQ